MKIAGKASKIVTHFTPILFLLILLFLISHVFADDSDNTTNKSLSENISNVTFENSINFLFDGNDTSNLTNDTSSYNDTNISVNISINDTNISTNYTDNNDTTNLSSSNDTITYPIPMDFSHAYISMNDTYILDVNGTMPLKIVGNIQNETGSDNITRFVGNGGYAYRDDTWLDRDAMRGNWTIHLREMLPVINQFYQPWILANNNGGAGGAQIFFCKDDDSSSNYGLIAGVWNGGSETELNDNFTRPNAGQEYSMDLRYNGTILSLFIDGNLVDEAQASIPAGFETCYGSGLFAVGCPYLSDVREIMTGEISQVFIYDRDLNDSEIKLLAQNISLNITIPEQNTTAPILVIQTPPALPGSSGGSRSSGGGGGHSSGGIVHSTVNSDADGNVSNHVVPQVPSVSAPPNTFYCITVGQKQYCKNSSDPTHLFVLYKGILYRISSVI